MEYCTEIAILQSAFQLASKKAGITLSDLPKENCKDVVNVIWASVEEILKGIEYDRDIDERLLWQQKLHAVLLYVLVKNKYKEKEEPGRLGMVPVCGVLDIFAEILPTYSSNFFFELMKCCLWTENFLQCLQCLDYKTASSLFDELLQHCRSCPVTLEDGKVISMVKDKLLSRCLCVPDDPSQLCVKLLQPLTQSRKYVQTMFPEEVKESDNLVAVETQKAKHDSLNNNNFAEIGFWDTYVEKNPHILEILMTSYEIVIEESSQLSSQKLLESLSQLAVWLYLTEMEPESALSDKWLINNLFVENNVENEKIREIPEIIYSLNFTMLPNIYNNLSKSRLIICLQKVLDKLSNSCELGGSTDSEGNFNITNHFGNSVHIVSGLSVNVIVLLRMVEGLLVKNEIAVEKSGVSKQMLTENGDTLPEIWRNATFSSSTDKELVLGYTWTNDVTMESLLWRIDNCLPQYEVCVDRLLDPGNIKFWMSDRLYLSLEKYPALLGRVDRVLKLTQILDSINEGNNTLITSSLLDLIVTSFSELSFPDQDTVVMEIYCRGHNSVQEFFLNGLESRVTNVFNKVTADIDEQVLREVILLCLGDPHLVLRMAVSLSVRNKQQARNCALILHQIQKTCKCCHCSHHPDRSLLAVLLHDFLGTHSLTEKEQDCFSVFVTDLMMPCGSLSNKDTDLSPSEFLQTTVLPCISVETLWSPNTITCTFAVELLLIALVAGCNKQCDWSVYELEPMALVLTLAEIKHECVVLWEVGNEHSGTPQEAKQTKDAKLSLKEKVNECIDRICLMISEKNLEVLQSDCYWLLEATRDLHWTVRLGLSPLYTACQVNQVKDDWLSKLSYLLEDPILNLVTILQFVAVNDEYIQTVLDNFPSDAELDSEDVIHALVQVLPQCVLCEFERVVKLIERLLSVKMISVTYRLQSTVNLPRLDLSELESALFTSQLLGDVILTLVMTLTPGSLLHHVTQCYISVMKIECEKNIENQELQSLYLGELFHHASQVTLHLPAEIMDSSLVFLLHILNKFKDVSKAIIKGQTLKGKNRTRELKMVKNLENGMMAAVCRLPDSCEEKNMLTKKLENHF